MADEDRSFSTDTPNANRTQMQGNGVGQQEMNEQQAPGGGDDLEPQEPRLGTATQANLDPRDIGEPDNPELDWGEPEPGAVFSSNNTRRPEKTEAERGQGPKTRARNKEINSGGA